MSLNLNFELIFADMHEKKLIDKMMLIKQIFFSLILKEILCCGTGWVLLTFIAISLVILDKSKDFSGPWFPPQ